MTLRESQMLSVTYEYVLIPEFCLIYYTPVDIDPTNIPREMPQFINHVSRITADLDYVAAIICLKVLAYFPSVHPRGELS